MIDYLGYGIRGAAYASTITSISNLVLIHLYVTFFLPDIRDSWTLPNRDSFIGLYSYLKVVLPAMLMLCIEWWTFEIQTLQSSRLNVESIAAQVIILNTIYVYFCITIGLQIAAYTLVGRSVGSKNIHEAKRYRKVIMISGFSLAITEAASLYLFRYQIASLFTNIESIKAILDETFQIISLAILIDNCQCWS